MYVAYSLGRRLSMLPMRGGGVDQRRVLDCDGDRFVFADVTAGFFGGVGVLVECERAVLGGFDRFPARERHGVVLSG